jgi:hypothetical protein
MAAEGPPRMHESMILYAQLLEARNRARRWFFINLAIAVIGGLLSLGSYTSASTNPEGGTYYVMWGAIAFGGFFAAKCAWRWLRCADVLRALDS